MIRYQPFAIIFLIAIFAYLLIIQPLAIWPFTIDDMYISLRYAKNWANGSGLLWNVHEAPVEGYSNFSYVVLAALGIKLGLNPVVLLKAAGWVGLYLTAFGLYCISRIKLSSSLALLPCIGLLLYKGEITWGISGLETAVYQALVIFSLLYLLKGSGYRYFPEPRGNIKKNYLIGAGFLLALASLTRPEAPLLLILFFAIAWLDCPQNNRDFLMGCIQSLLTFSLFYLPYFLWRWNYYDRLFPNPIYCKGITNSFFLLLDKNYLKLAWPFLLLALPAVWHSKDKLIYYLLLPSLLYLILLADADPVVAFSNRLFLPAFSLLLIAACLGLKQGVEYFINEPDLSKTIIVIIACLIAFFFIPIFSLKNYREFSIDPKKGEQLRYRVNEWLNKENLSGGRVVLADSGMIPYLSSLNFIDSYCLNNKEMTKKVDDKMYYRFCEQILIDKPEVIILTALIERGKVLYTPADRCLNKALKMNGSYIFRTSLQTEGQQSYYRYEIYTALN